MVHVASFLFLSLLFVSPAAADIYRWTGSDGIPRFSDRPPPGAARVDRETTPPARESTWQRVAEVLDGDTVRLEDGRSVRLIGLNAPEVARRGRPGERGGYEARKALTGYLSGRLVRLVVGVEASDRYGRTLAHLFDQQGRNVNAQLLRGGWVHAEVYPPNDRHAAVYLGAEADARAAGRGLWAYPVYRVLPAADAVRHRNSFRRLRGRAEAAERGAEMTLDGVLRLRFAPDALPHFLESGLGVGRLVGKTVTVRGRVRQRGGRPLIHLRHPLQIEAVE